MKKLVYFIIAHSLSLNLICCDSNKSNSSLITDKSQLLSLEQKWLTAEFALDTTYLSSIIDSSFIDISEDGLHNKSQALLSMYQNITQRIKDSIFIDSFFIEDPVVNVYQTSAVVTFVVHTFRSDKGVKSEHKTRFYDVWTKQNNTWKAVSSQGTKIE